MGLRDVRVSTDVGSPRDESDNVSSCFYESRNARACADGTELASLYRGRHESAAWVRGSVGSIVL